MIKRATSLTLIGFQSSGKTTLGQKLAYSLCYAFLDTDQLIEQFHPNMTCREIFQSFGSTYFRNLEERVIASLHYSPSLIVATGGGSLMQDSNAASLKEHSVLIYLKTSANCLKERMWKQKTLPTYLIEKDPHQAFVRLYEERSQLYEKWADYTLEMDHLTQDGALKNILHLIKQI